MSDLSDPSWGAYTRLQAELSHDGRICDHTWGLETALNRILAFPQAKHTNEDVDRMAASARRRERHRTRLRLAHAARADTSPSSETIVAARQELRAVRAKVVARDWALLCEVAGGRRYDEVAEIVGETPGSLRVRVLRLRRQLSKAA